MRKKVVDSDKPVSDFRFTVDGRTTPFDPTGENIVTLTAGTYTVTEPPVSGFTTTYQGCSDIVVRSPQPPVPVCVITNTADQEPPDTVWPVGNFVTCVDNVDDGTFVAWFGYESSNETQVTIPIGELNQVTPGVNRGQPSTFQPGKVESAFSATGRRGDTIRWEITTPPVSRNAFPWTSEATAGADFETKCSSPPEPPARTVDVFVTCVENAGETYSARFGYENPGSASVSLAIGAQNRFTPGDEYRGQPELFTPGRVDVAVVVGGISNSVALTWTVATGNGPPSTATARDTLETKCSDEPLPPDPPPDPPPPDPPPGPPPPPPDQRPIGIFVQCITTRGDTYDAVFGYQNDNAYTVAIPVGPDNRFSPGGDRGQTTTFLPGNHQDAFTVEQIPSRTLTTWAVTYAGATRFARPDAGFTECSAEPPGLQPIGLFACIVDRGDSFDAVFGYENDNPVDITVPIGLQNFVIPRPVNRNQPTVLSPGRHENAFTVRGVDSAILGWTVKHEGVRTVVVTAEYPIKCAGSPPTTLPLKVFPLCVRKTGSTYMARFGYINPNHGDVVLPIGAANFVGPRPADRGQPTTLRPGIAWSAFTVRRIPLKGAVTWTVKYAGETAKAKVTADLRRNCVTTEEGPVAQLEIDKSVEPDAAVVGDLVTFKIVVRNEGTTTAQNATVIDRVLDDRIVQLSAKPSQGRCVVRSGSRVICRLGPLDPGDAATITVLARARAPGESRNRAVVLSLPRGLRGRQHRPCDDGGRSLPRAHETVLHGLSAHVRAPVALPVAAALALLVLAPAAARPTDDPTALSHGRRLQVGVRPAAGGCPRGAAGRRTGSHDRASEDSRA